MLKRNCNKIKKYGIMYSFLLFCNLFHGNIGAQEGQAIAPNITPGWSMDQIVNIRPSTVVVQNWLSRRYKSYAEGMVRYQDQLVPNYPLVLTITDFTTGEVRKTLAITSNTGRFGFHIFTNQHWYKNQRYFLKMVHFSENSQSPGEDSINITKFIGINPWSYTQTHGFEITKNNFLPATCLNGTETEKQFLQQLLDEEDNDKVRDLLGYEHYEQVVKKLFCYNESLQKFYEVNTHDYDNSVNSSVYSVLTLKELFLNFREALKDDITEWVNNQLDVETSSADYIFSLFQSATKTPTPEMHIQSLRYYTIRRGRTNDTGYLEYDISFKLTPRVVLYDDLTRGQQVRVPLRDGIYVLQLAIIKDKSGEGGQIAADYPQTTDTTVEGTTPLYECDITKDNNCLTIRDFIVPPTNIPVVFQAGDMTGRVQLKIPLQQKEVSESDLKNLLVLRIMPADPMSICPPDNKACMQQNPAPIHLPLNRLNVIPMTDSNYSSLVTPTYKVSFNVEQLPLLEPITEHNELKETFDELTERYYLEKQREQMNQ